MADENEQDSPEIHENVSKTQRYSRPGEFVARFLKWTDRLFDIENHRFLVGLNSGFVSAMITTLYSNPRLALRTRLIVPAVCAVTGATSWELLVTKQIENKELDCSICANMRGLALAVFSACVLPACVGAVITARRHLGFLTKAEKFTESFSDTLIQRPVVVAAILAQGSIGYIMASREFELNFLKRLGK